MPSRRSRARHEGVVSSWMRPCAVVLASCLCAATTLSASRARAGWLARYHVDFGRAETGVPTADVRASLNWVGKSRDRPGSVEVRMAEDGFPKGYGAFVRDFRVVAPEGAPGTPPSTAAEALSAREGRYRVPLLQDGSTTFRYRVVMEHDASDWGPGPDEGPYRFEGGAFWTGRALFITPPDARVEVAFAASEGEHVTVSFEPIPGRDVRYAVPDASRLQDSFLVVGDHHETRLTIGRALVILALGSGLADSMPVVERAVRRFLDAAGGIFGGAPPARILIAGNLGAPPGSLYGGGFADDLSVLADEPLTEANAGRWRPFLCHEIFHLWNGNAIDFGERQQYWFSEGFTEYYSQLLPVRLGEASGERFLATLERKASAYLGVAGGMSLLAAGDEKFLNHALVYDGGALAALTLDLKIRAATSNRRSLDDVMRALYRRARDRKGAALSFPEVVREASRAAGRPMDDFFLRFIEGKEDLPLADSLALAGIHLAVESAELPDLMSVLETLLLCSSVSGTPDGLKVHRTDSDQIRPGDLIVEARGMPVRAFDDLRRAFLDVEPASRCAIVVMRDGRRIELDLVLGGGAQDVIPRSRHSTVRIEVAPQADPAAQKIRRSILGAAGPA